MLQGEPILILGVFRSGTSLLASALENLGVYLGPPDDFFPPNENNPGGYWEMRSLVELNMRAYSVLGLNFYSVDSLPPKWQESPISAPLVQEIRRLIREKFEGHHVWGWKEPSTTGLIPIYREVLKSEGVTPRYAICVRHPLSIAASQSARVLAQSAASDPADAANISSEITAQTIGMWVHYTLTALRESKGANRMVVSYERFLGDPKATIEATAKHLLTAEPNKKQLEDAISAVKPSWSHNKFTEEDLKPWPPVVAQTYDLCMRAADDPEGLNTGAYDEEVDTLSKRFSAMRHMIRPLALPAGQMMLSWRKGQGIGQNSIKYAPTGQWQTLSGTVDASSASQVQVDLYQTPCHIWIRKAIWKVDGKERAATLAPGPSGMLQDLFGMKRLVVFGPNPLMTQVPPCDSPPTLELEFMVSANQQVLTEVVGVLRGRLDQVRR